ncbi:uncharacterized protein LOC121376432 [Gigantopelta aegis]|uniref:uncharacterized protein LOC121376432 n=1 Tax=Gigantopelta aegis TaxID=1735272 RepID=UPI001B88B679|nr:uncharacterized protein LOC121376432 [Gigantopelta aegis]
MGNFVLPPNILRLLEMLCSIVAFSLIFGWKSEGVTYRQLDHSEYDVINNIDFFLGMSVLTLLIVSILCFVILIKPVYLSPCLDLVINALLGGFLLIAAIVMCSSLTQLGNSITVKEAGLTFSSMEGAIAFGFICSLSLAGNSWFAYQAHRQRSDIPLNQSHAHASLPVDIPT